MQSTTPLTPAQIDGKTQLSRFVFTLNNWTALEYEWLKAFECKWMIIGKEVGASGTPHLQGAVVLNTRRQFNSLKKMIGFARAHIEPMLGTPEDSVKYCTKEDKNAFMKGSVEPGKRNDIHDAINKLKTAISITDLVTKDDDFAATFVKYPNGLTSYRNQLEAKRQGPPTVFWIYGETGTGKTRSSVEWAEARGLDYWMSLGGLQWFNGYDGEPVAILDDFRTGHCKFSFLLRLLDRYRFSVPYKGGFRNWAPKIIFVTAPLPPREMFDLKKEGDVQQLERRITHMVQSPITVEQLNALSADPINREDKSVAEESGVQGEDRRNGFLIDLTDLSESSGVDTTVSYSSGSSSEGLFEEKPKNIKTPGLKKTKTLIDLSKEDEREGERRVNKKRKLNFK
nr:MAG: replication associated protein [Arizlama virus]